MVSFLNSGLASFQFPQNNNFKPLSILALSAFTVLFFSIFLFFYYPRFYKAPFSRSMDSYARFANSYVNVNGWKFESEADGVTFSDKGIGSLYIVQFRDTGEVHLYLRGSERLNRLEPFPLKDEFYNDSEYRASVAEIYFKKIGVVDPNFFAVINEDNNRQNLPVEVLYTGDVASYGKWNFASSAQNGGLKKIDLSIYLTTSDRVFAELEWTVDSKYVSDEIPNLEYGAMPLGSRLLFLLYLPYLMLTATLSYLSFGAGLVVFVFQIILLSVEVLYIIYVFQFALKNVNQSRVRLLWLLLGVFDVMVFYLSIMLSIFVLGSAFFLG